MKSIEYNEEKNLKLKTQRGVSFEDIKHAVAEGGLVAIVTNPDQKRYPGQKLLIVSINKYAYVAPFVEDKKKLFLKTIYPSRKYTKLYVTRKERIT